MVFLVGNACVQFFGPTDSTVCSYNRSHSKKYIINAIRLSRSYENQRPVSIKKAFTYLLKTKFNIFRANCIPIYHIINECAMIPAIDKVSQLETSIYLDVGNFRI